MPQVIEITVYTIDELSDATSAPDVRRMPLAFGGLSSQLSDFHGETAAHEPCIPLDPRMNRAIPCASPPYAQGFPQTLWPT